ncbi:uncharacterized protein LOC116340667 [Contarinia nasturtii]|uniref:uncharacterized protein LOC116340667 n=1 Tax=Contarinia nasturtii TaxID=265458 RepID=UPI0012D4901C|nr:uncharacterized protein LOC116340667 [Contarinia nasturtii]
MLTDDKHTICSTDSVVSKRNSHKTSTDSTTEPPSKRVKVHVTSRRRKGIRSLVSMEPNSPKESNKHVILFGILTVIFVFIGLLMRSEEFRKELKHVAMNQFQLYLHGRENYCNEPFEHWHISNAMHNRIIGQGAVLDKIDDALQQHENVTALAFIGTQGVGKTLCLNLIQNSFQWHLNMHQYIWSLIQSPDDQLKHLLRLIDSLSTCGMNGIFIDNVPLKYVGTINRFNQKLQAYSNKNHIKLLVIYVFQTNNPLDANEPLQIENVKSINFRRFNRNDIRICINMESDRLKLSITQDQIEELLNNIDAERHGCKHVAARIAREEEIQGV